MSVALSVFSHMRLKKFLLACLIASFSTTILFQVLGFIVLGYLDPFFIIATITTFTIALCISLFVGSIFYFKRRAIIKENTETN
jgi:membrane protein DedA with SNARE-associated domain